MNLKALIFDFDGLLLDTETPSFQAWVDLYREQGAELRLEHYVHCVGTHGSAFDAVSHLEALTGRSQDRAQLERRHREIALSRIEPQPPLPGVTALLSEAHAQGIACAVASSSPRDWVEGNLARLGILSRFGALVCRADVERVKPAPDLFLEACRRSGAKPSEAIVFEDSLNGVTAARAAGIFCVAVPNAVTRGLALDGADLLVISLERVTLPILEKALASKSSASMA